MHLGTPPPPPISATEHDVINNFNDYGTLHNEAQHNFKPMYELCESIHNRINYKSRLVKGIIIYQNSSTY